MGHFERPVLILHGAEDEIVPIGYSVKAVKKYPNARLEEFAHEPHGFFQRMEIEEWRQCCCILFMNA